MSSDLGRGASVEVLEKVGEVVDGEWGGVDLGCEGFEEPVLLAIM
jgi:hypothetical protein